jgi:hypothetical protein
VVEIATTVVSFVFAALVWLGLVNPASLLFFVFLIGVGAALSAPPWQAVVPSLVPKDDLPAAVAVNSIGVNVSRADREPFLAAVGRLGHERRRDGAYAWDILEDVAQPGRFLETFRLESWLEHLYQHERVTNADTT